jgi:hypothetical protein
MKTSALIASIKNNIEKDLAMFNGKYVRRVYSRRLALMVGAGIAAAVGTSLLPDIEGKMYLAFRLRCFFTGP